MALALPLHANNELVTLAWIRDVVTAYGVSAGTTLQGPDPETLVLPWGDVGFVTTLTVGGSVNTNTPMREPVMSVECVAANVGKSRPPWGRAIGIAELIIRATEWTGWGSTARAVVLPSGYPGARVWDGSALTEPKRVPSDEAGYARYSFDMSMSWVEL